MWQHEGPSASRLTYTHGRSQDTRAPYPRRRPDTRVLLSHTHSTPAVTATRCLRRRLTTCKTGRGRRDERATSGPQGCRNGAGDRFTNPNPPSAHPPVSLLPRPRPGRQAQPAEGAASSPVSPVHGRQEQKPSPASRNPPPCEGAEAQATPSVHTRERRVSPGRHQTHALRPRPPPPLLHVRGHIPLPSLWLWEGAVRRGTSDSGVDGTRESCFRDPLGHPRTPGGSPQPMESPHAGGRGPPPLWWVSLDHPPLPLPPAAGRSGCLWPGWVKCGAARQRPGAGVGPPHCLALLRGTACRKQAKGSCLGGCRGPASPHNRRGHGLQTPSQVTLSRWEGETLTHAAARQPRPRTHPSTHHVCFGEARGEGSVLGAPTPGRGGPTRAPLWAER